MGLLPMAWLGQAVDGLDRDDPAAAPLRPGPKPDPERRPVGAMPPGVPGEVRTGRGALRVAEISEATTTQGARVHAQQRTEGRVGGEDPPVRSAQAGKGDRRAIEGEAGEKFVRQAGGDVGPLIQGGAILVNG